MSLTTFIPIILAIVIGLIVWKLTKSVLKAVSLALTILLITVSICGYLVVSDAIEFQENLQTSQNLFLFEYENEIISGFSGKFSDEMSNFNFLSESKINSYKGKDYESMLGKNYKLFLINSKAFESIGDIQSGDLVYTKQEMFEMLESDNPVDLLVEKQLGEKAEESQLPAYREQMFKAANVNTNTELKGVLFGMLLSKAMEDKGPIMIFEEYKKGNIIIYKETRMFKLIKIMPLSLLKKYIPMS